MNFYIKLQLIILMVLFGVIPILAQIPNAGFENWAAGEPDGWSTNNISGQFTPVTQSSNSHSGSSAIQLSVFDIGGGLGVAPLISSIEPGSSIFGFPLAQPYQELTGYFQFTPMANALLQVTVQLFNTTPTDTTAVGVGIWATGSATTSYSQFSAPVYYLPGAPPANWAWILVQITDTLSGFPVVGANALIDDLAFQGIVGVEDEIEGQIAQDFDLQQNYPNPFNPSTQISFSLPINSEVNIVIYDQLGREVDRLRQGTMNAGNHTVSWSARNLPSGIYYYQLQVGDRKLTRQMILMK